MRKSQTNIENFWFITLLLLQIAVIILFSQFLQDKIYLIIFVSSIFLTLLFYKMYDIFVRPLEQINEDIEKFREGKVSRIGKYSEHHLLGNLTNFFDAIMDVLSKVRDEYLAWKVLSDDVSHASELQRFMIGKKHKILGWLEIIGSTRPAQEINGDSYDFFQKQDQVYIYAGDATGHGVTSGLIGSMTNALMEAFWEVLIEGDRVVSEVNSLLFTRLYDARIMTLALLRWDTNISRLYLTWAGHEHLLVYRAESWKIDVYRSDGIALGMKRDITRHTHERHIPFGARDRFILYSDGITEAVREVEWTREKYGLDRLKQAIKNVPDKTPSSIFRNITEDLSSFMGKEFHQKDDITLVCGGVSLTGKLPSFPEIRVGDHHWNWS